MILSYGVNETESELDLHQEEIQRLGYTIIDSGLNKQAVVNIGLEIERCKKEYIRLYGDDFLKSIGEHNGIRMPLTMSEHIFNLVFNDKLLSYIDKLMYGNFLLNQQNVVINPAKESYNQALWHRDLPYQHFVSSRPLAINALFCVDDFTVENGSSWVVPGSHKEEKFPSEDYMNKHAIQVEAKAGSFILLDCMTYHKGGFNQTNNTRRAINHVFSTPMISQQIKFRSSDFTQFDLTDRQKFILGLNVKDNSSVKNYLASRS